MTLNVSEKDVLVMHPLLVLLGEYGDPVAMEMLISVAQTFKVWPATQEIVVVKVSRDGNVRDKILVFLHQLSKYFLDRILVDDIHVNRPLCSVVKHAKILQQHIEWPELGGALFHEADHVAAEPIVIFEKRNVSFRPLIVKLMTDEVMNVVFQD